MHGDNDMLTGLYAGVIDCMPIGVVALGSELAIVMMNRAARQIVGQDADWTDHPAQQWLDALFGAERAQPLILKLREVMATGRAFSQELPAGTGTLELTASLLSGEEAAATGVLLLQDITERRRLEQGLREQEQQFSLIYDHVSDVLFYLAVEPDDRFRFLSVNRVFLQATGLAEGQVIGREVRQVIPEPARELVLGKYREAIRERRTATWEETSVYPAGKKHGEVSVTPVFDAAGHCTHLVGMVHDVTESRIAHERIRASEERYRAFLENSMDAILLTSPDGSIQAANPAACQLFERTEAEIVQVGRAGLVNTSDRRLPDLLAERARTGRARGELNCLRRDGTLFPAELSSAVFRDSDGQLRTSMIVRDTTERKQAEESLRHSDAFLNSIIEHSPHAMWISDDKGTLIRLNQACRDLLHITDEEVVGKYNVLQDNIVQEQGYLPLVRQVFENGETVRFSLRYDSSQLRHPSLEKTTFLILDVTVSAVLDASGRVTHAIIQHIDITEREQAIETLRQSEAQYRTLFEAMMRGVVYQDAEGRIISANPAAERILGLTLAQMQGTTSLDPHWRAIHPGGSDFPGDQHPAMVALRTGKPVRNGIMAVFNPRKEEDIWISVNAVPQFRPGEERPHQVFTTFDDISELLQAQAALRESEQRYRLLAENVSDVIWTMDLDQRFTYVSPSVTPLRGYSVTEVMGQTLEQVLVPASYEVAMQAFREELSAEDIRDPLRSRTLELEVTCEDGSTIWTEVKVSILRDVEGTPIGILGVTRDIAARKKLEAQFLQAQKMEALGRLAGGVAHDLNNILTAVLGYAEFALAELDPDLPACQDLEEIEQAAHRAAALTNQLLIFSRKQVIQPRVLSLNTVIAGFERMLRRLIGEDIRLVTILDPALGLVHADAGQLEQVIMNLAVNARDAMPKGGQLIIETANVMLDESYARTHLEMQPGSYAMLAVSDTGTGMSPEIQARLFEPFFTTKEQGKGTGLGLSTVYGIVRQSGGHVEVYSEAGLGTTFKIYLPLAESEDKMAEWALPPDELPRGTETILLVEDDEAVLKLGRLVLEKQGYVVLSTDRPSEAYALVEAHGGPIHLLITDVVMPGVGGRELAALLRPLCPDMRVLYSSGYTGDAIAHRGIVEQGIAFLPKPFTAGALARTVREALDNLSSGRARLRLPGAD